MSFFEHIEAIVSSKFQRNMVGHLIGTPCAGIIARDGVAGLYRGFVPNALKTLPNSRFA